MTQFHPDARAEIQRVYDDPSQEQLADRIEELLDLLAKDPGNRHLRKHRMHKPAYWLVKIHGSDRDFAFFWEIRDNEPWVLYAGDY